MCVHMLSCTSACVHVLGQKDHAITADMVVCVNMHSCTYACICIHVVTHTHKYMHICKHTLLSTCMWPHRVDVTGHFVCMYIYALSVCTTQEVIPANIFCMQRERERERKREIPERFHVCLSDLIYVCMYIYVYIYIYIYISEHFHVSFLA